MQEDKQNMIRKVPIVPIRGSIVFPNTDVVLTFGRKRSVVAVNSAFQTDKIVAIFAQKDAKTQDPKFEDLYSTGTIAVITQMMSTNNEIHCVVKGQARVKLLKISEKDPFITGEVKELNENPPTDETRAFSNKLIDLFKKAINLGKQAEVMTVMKLISGTPEPNEVADQIASLLEIKTADKQELLETLSLKTRLEKVLQYLTHEVNVLELEKTISTKTQKRFEEQMRKTMLLEKKRTIEKELGEEELGDMTVEESETYKRKIKEAHMPKDVEDKAKKELKRLTQMSPHNPEGGYLRNYLDWLCDMPWSKVTPNNVSIVNAEKVLEHDHYGLGKAKERILEYLAVMKIKNSKKSSADEGKKDEAQPTILCFIGPPGVGKTSIGKSIARALKRKFVRVSLGGIRDEAEIRGHRRTYVGALPGRIVQGIKNAGSKNPVFMLDEIDKIGTDFRGDPSSALLEALDPEQNSEFSDHYLEVPFDLSEVMFIATGNMIETIPAALRDRMEIINFPGYTQDEKYNIAEKFLWSKQLKLHGLDDTNLKLEKEALNEIIERYTREAGVRDLERNLATALRKVAKLVADKKNFPKNISKSDVRKFLGPQKFTSVIAENKDEVGMSTGLAVTPAGGEILFIEVSLMPGKGHLTLTGQLGDVMKESARAAFTWTRSHWEELGLKKNFNQNIDVHIHVPEGAVPKDGPSAGIAITTALVSALTQIPVKREIGMTGEITLRGRVLEIGGVKEKVIAGHRAGLKTIILPKGNEKDMEDVPKEVIKDVKFYFVDNYSDVIKIALKSYPKSIKAKTKKRM